VDRPRLLGTFSQWFALAVAAALGVTLFALVDLEPQVEADFFFSTDDPQLRTSLRIEEEFGYAPQVLVAVRAPRLVSRNYLLRLRDLTEDLRGIEGVADVRSLTRGPEQPETIAERNPEKVFEDLRKSPFWTSLLLARDRSSTFIVLSLRGERHEATVSAIDRVLARHDRSDLQLAASGVPYVAEHIRRRLTGDLQRFSVAAFVAFAVLVTILFRSFAVVLGTMVAALIACFATFLVLRLLGMSIGILTPNLWTIAFVLTLSHVVYLTAQWRRKAGASGGEQAVREAVRLTGPASAWSLAANLLGFASLIFVSAKPLREFGMSGGIAAVLAMACAYGVYPAFLRAARPPSGRRSAMERRLERFFTTRHSLLAGLMVVVAVGLAPFAWRVNTDPGLPSYFGVGDRLRTGLGVIDRAAGSSPLDVVVEDARGARLYDDEPYARLTALQERLERHPDVGSVLSIALLMAETERSWAALLTPWEWVFRYLDRPEQEQIGRTFVSEDRRRGRFLLRMREEARSRPREIVVREIEEIVREQGFKPVLVGGLYRLQGEMAKLVEGSVVRGLGGLIGLFFLIVLVVMRSVASALAMTFCLALTPFILFGLVALFGMPLDIISAPAANVALPLGIDEMIHLGYAVRSRRGGAGGAWAAWKAALVELWRPILASMLIVSSGFALFLLSSFPSTQRLGVLVCVGAALTDLVVLVVLPAIVTLGRSTATADRNRGGSEGRG
jgi:uncharacterized protein